MRFKIIMRETKCRLDTYPLAQSNINISGVTLLFGQLYAICVQPRHTTHLREPCTIGGWMRQLFIYLFIYIYWRSRIVALVLYYYFIMPRTSKGDMSASVICHFYSFF